MNCYAGLAKRIVKSCFPQVVPVPQLEPLDASKIIKQEVKDFNTNKVCFALSDAEERLFNTNPLTDEEVWAATLAWAETKAQEREAEALKASSQTETDQSYVSDDYEVGVQTQPIRKSALFGYNDEFDKKRVSFGVISVVEVKKFMKEDYVDDWSKDGKHLIWEGRSAATIIQATERGRAGRAYNAFASANKKPSKAVHFTAFNHPLSKALPIDIYDQDAWYRAALRTQPAAPLHRLLRPRRLEQSSVRNWATLRFNQFIYNTLNL